MQDKQDMPEDKKSPEKKKQSGAAAKKLKTVRFVKRYAAYIYLGLAVVMVAVMSVSIFSISNAGNISDIDISVPVIELPEPVVDSPVIDSPVADQPSNIPGKIDPVTPTYRHPVNGETVKSWSMTALVFSQTMKDYRTHSGIDIAAEIGDTVVCYAAGTVSEVYNDAFMGTTVKVSHEGGLVTVYSNLADTVADGIAAGAKVKAGQAIGTVGNTASSESADPSHLHFEMLVNGNSIDPEEQLKYIE